MVWTIEEINQNPYILPNITIGFKIVDSCYSEARALMGTMWMITGQQSLIPNYCCTIGAPLVGIVGDLPSESSIAIARLLGLYKYPQISYGSVLPVLSDKQQFPSFLRTVSSGTLESYSLALLVRYFGWTWTGILASNNDYGKDGSLKLQQEIAKLGGCIAFIETIPLDSSIVELSRIAEIIRASKATVIILYSPMLAAVPIFEEIARYNITDRVWVISAGWFLSSGTYKEEIRNTLNGSILIRFHLKNIFNIKQRLSGVNPNVFPNDIFFKDFWEAVFGCWWLDNTTAMQDSQIKPVFCQGTEKLDTLPESTVDTEHFIAIPAVYKAVYAMAYSLHSVSTCKNQEYNVNGTCHNIRDVQPWQILKAVRNIRFRIVSGEEVYFDANGDPPSLVDILNLQVSQNGVGSYKVVGLFDANYPVGHQIIVNVSNIKWSGEHKEFEFVFNMVSRVSSSPSSTNLFGSQQLQMDLVNLTALINVLNQRMDTFASRLDKVDYSLSQQRSFQNANSQVTHSQRVSAGDMVGAIPGSNTPSEPTGVVSANNSIPADSTNCVACPSDECPNEKRVKCIPKLVQFLSFSDPLSVALGCVASFCVSINTIILAIFIKANHTPIVKANNRELSYCILAALFLCFLSSFLFLYHPTKISCILRQTAFGFNFSICVSCILAKTVTVVFAFNATKPSSRVRKWVKYKISSYIVIICSVIQLFIYLMWLSTSPPFPEVVMESDECIMSLQCNEGSSIAYWCKLGYVAVLSTVSLTVAFLARKLPDNFNEAKFITFSMLVFLSVWLSFIPAYLSTRGKYTVAVELFAILCSSAGMMGCIFFPKCYIILWRPDKNTKEQMMGKAVVSKQKII
ncbi:extracellular calcium-sensing receptor-like [Protopterus annectens]|uniref:extracellular calcium-sensing receptor-like n=1 Tax=Protopterus annectens TaxID=7888 RepID=UPI001CFC0857|nr:extracellular calcium-sensing receptor-like [Protopterus annectens]